MVKSDQQQGCVAPADTEHQRQPADEFDKGRDQAEPFRHPARHQAGSKSGAGP